MGKKILFLCIVSVLLAYYAYSPVPENIEERWKLMFMNVVFRTLGHVADVVEKLGLVHHMETMKMIASMDYTEPVSDEKVSVTDTKMNGVPVRLYIPKGKPDSLKRAVIYIHGGGWCLGGPWDPMTTCQDGLLKD